MPTNIHTNLYSEGGKGASRVFSLAVELPIFVHVKCELWHIFAHTLARSYKFAHAGSTIKELYLSVFISLYFNFRYEMHKQSLQFFSIFNL
jgi:hypothetical protein